MRLERSGQIYLRCFCEVLSIGFCDILVLDLGVRGDTDSWAALPRGIKEGTEFWEKKIRVQGLMSMSEIL